MEWRPVRCWAYYCLGQSEHRKSGHWEPSDPADERYHKITDSLEWVLLDFLPDALRRYEEVYGDPLEAYLCDPLDFADAFGDALFVTFVAPFADRYSVIDAEPL